MHHAAKTKALKIVLIIVSLIFTFGLYPFMLLWPSGFTWTPRQLTPRRVH